MVSLPKNQTTSNPRISINDLARYMVSGESGKLGIVKRAKENSTPVVTRYKDVRKAMASALAQPSRSRAIIESCRSLLEGMANDPSSSSFVKDDAEKSLDVVDCFEQMQNEFGAGRFELLPKRSPKLHLGGVEVSVGIDALIHDGTDKKPLIGGLVFRMTKPDEGETEAAKSKRKEMGLYVATAVQLAVKTHHELTETTSHKFCWSADVQAREIWKAPTSYKRRVTDMTAACTMIAAYWDLA